MQLGARVHASDTRGPGWISKQTKSKSPEGGAPLRDRLNICSRPFRKPFLGSATGQLVLPGWRTDLHYRPWSGGEQSSFIERTLNLRTCQNSWVPPFIKLSENWGTLTVSTKWFAETKWAQEFARALCAGPQWKESERQESRMVKWSQRCFEEGT